MKIQTDLYKAYIDSIYDLNAEIFFNVAYEETSKGVYKLNENIDKKTLLKDEIKTDDREDVIKKFRNIYEDEINIEDNTDKSKINKTIDKDDFKEKLKYFNDTFYKNKKEDLIKDINLKVFN